MEENMRRTINIDELNDYDRMSALAHEAGEPILVEVDGEPQLVFMAIEVFEELFGDLDIEMEAINLNDD